MAAEKRQAQDRPGFHCWQDVGLAILLFALAFGLRWLYASVVVFPPLDGPAFYLTSAENLVTGRGLEVDVLWSYQTLFSSVTLPSHERWMPLPTGIIAAAFALLDDTLRTGQLQVLIKDAVLAPLTYLFCRRALPATTTSDRKARRWIALGAALLIAVNATLGYQSASADSSSTFALLAAWALALAARPPGDRTGYFGVGLLAGLAYLTRSDGLLLLVAVPLAWWQLPQPAHLVAGKMRKSAIPEDVWQGPEDAWQGPEDAWQGPEDAWHHETGPRLANLLDLAVGFALVVAPWLVRNYLAFGTPLPGSVLSQAWLTDYVETLNYASHPTLETYLHQGWQALLSLRAESLLHNGRVFLLNTFPWGLLALPGLWLLRRERAFYPPFFYGLLLFFGLALIIPVSSMAGTFYHSLGAVMPFLAVAAAYATYRGTRRFSRSGSMLGPIYATLMTGLLVLAGPQVLVSRNAVAECHQAEKQQFERAAAWLAEHASPGDVVMATQSYTLNYASGLPSIVLPGGEPPDAARAAARRYGALVLIITQPFGLYPQVLEEQPAPRFQLLSSTEDTRFYAVQGGQP